MQRSAEFRSLAELEKGILVRYRSLTGSDNSGDLPKQVPQNRIQVALECLAGYDHLVSLLYRLRGTAGAELSRAEDLAAELAHEFLPFARDRAERGYYSRWIERYREIWWAERELLWFTVLLFACSCLIGWNLGLERPEYVAVLVEQGLLESILSRESWFESISKAPLVMGLLIAANNIQVAINCFVGGAVLGIGGLMILFFNGLHVGAILGYCTRHEFDEPLWRFISSHGPLELSIFVCAAFASLIYGRSFYLRPWREFPQNLAANGRRAGVVALGILPWLLVAATIEAFVSPFQLLNNTGRILLGYIIAAWFWCWNFGLSPRRLIGGVRAAP